MILVLPILVKAIERSKLFKRFQYVKHKDGRIHRQGYWVSVPKLPNGKKLKVAIAEAEKWCIENGKKDPGREFGVIISTDGASIHKIHGDVGKIKLDDVADELPGSVFVHNHPSGVTFSFMDIKTYFTHEILEMRVVGNGKRFIFRALKDAWLNVMGVYGNEFSKRKSQDEAMRAVGKERGVAYVEE